MRTVAHMVGGPVADCISSLVVVLYSGSSQRVGFWVSAVGSC